MEISAQKVLDFVNKIELDSEQVIDMLLNLPNVDHHEAKLFKVRMFIRAQQIEIERLKDKVNNQA